MNFASFASVAVGIGTLRANPLRTVLSTLGVVLWAWGPVRGGGRPSGFDNVLLVTVDTLRWDALGAWGQPRATSPVIDRLAASGVRFETAHAHNTVTLPSHANILSGRYPFDHGVRDNAGFRFPIDITQREQTYSVVPCRLSSDRTRSAPRG